MNLFSAVNATSGFFAGGIAGLVMNPIDVIKSRAQRKFLSFRPEII